MKKIALVELGGSHDECLYAQLLFLENQGFETIDLWVNERLADAVAFFDKAHQTSFLPSSPTVKDLYNFRQTLIQRAYDLVIFNTCQGNNVKNLLLLPFPSHITFAGILHNTGKINGSWGQSLISRKITRYFFLNDFLLRDKNDPKLSTFYPIFFPEYPQVALPKREKEIWISVPGQVELKRRDYSSMVEALGQLPKNSPIKVIFLGNSTHQFGDGEALRSMAIAAGIEHRLVIFNEKLPNDVFYTYIQKSNYIMPLIHPGHSSFPLYQHQITGAFNLAFGFKKPLLMESAFNTYADFRENALFYSQHELVPFLAQLSPAPSDQMYMDPKWTFCFQQRKYLQHLQVNLAAEMDN